MTKTQLNINQISGIAIVLLGEFIHYYLESDTGYIFTLFGLLVFLLGSKLNLGIIISVILFFAGNISMIMYGSPLLNFMRVGGVIGIIAFGYYQFIYKKKDKNIRFMFFSIAVFLVASLQLNWNVGVILSIIALTMLILAYTYRFFKKPDKNFEDYLKLAIGYNIIILYLLTTLRMPGEKFFLYLLYTLLIIWLGISLKREIKKH